MLSSDEHPWKAEVPMLVIPSGRRTVLRASHINNIPSGSSVSACGKVISIREPQSLKAYSPMEKTLPGSTIFCSASQPEKADLPISWTPTAMETSVSDGQTLKAKSPIFDTDAGMLTLSSDIHCANA